MRITWKPLTNQLLASGVLEFETFFFFKYNLYPPTIAILPFASAVHFGFVKHDEQQSIPLYSTGKEKKGHVFTTY